jgi:hypothetical protein
MGTMFLPVRTNSQFIYTLKHVLWFYSFCLSIVVQFLVIQSMFLKLCMVMSLRRRRKILYGVGLRYRVPYSNAPTRFFIYFFWDINGKSRLKSILFYMFRCESLNFGCRLDLRCSLSSAVYWRYPSQMLLMIQQKVIKFV